MYYNFVRIHQTLKVTPAMAAGVTDRLWEISDIVKLPDDWQERQRAELEKERLARYWDASEISRQTGRKSSRFC